MKKQLQASALAALLLAAAPVFADDDAPAKAPPVSKAAIEKQDAILKAAQGALVIVEYTLQYDKGEPPQGRGGIGDLVREERPLEEAGFLVDGTHVLTVDMQIHPRFIKSIAVRRWPGDAKAAPRVAATVAGYPKGQNFEMLQLSAGLEGATPTAFDDKRAGPYSTISLTGLNGEWAAEVGSLGGDLISTDSKKLLGSSDYGASLIVDAKGAAVGVKPWGQLLPADDSWKGSPMQWPSITAADMQKSLADLDDRASKNIVRVMLNFRSPKTVQPDSDGRGESATVQYVLGVLVDGQTVLVLNEMKPTLTARLERIKVLTDPPIEAKFKASFTDYGAFVATLDKPASGPGLARLSSADIQSLLHAELPTAQVYMQGEKRISYVQPRRIEGFNLGWRRNAYPEIAGESNGLFLFDPEGALLALPVSRREKVSTEERYGRDQTLITSIAQLDAALKDLKNSSDTGNVPLTEEEENRVAWLGYEMQPMNAELAQANNVSDQTNDGQTGALVTFVYPDSPAAKAGVEQGWILLRIDAPDQPKPIDIHVEPDPMAERGPFPWEQLDGAQESNFENIFRYYSPWPRVNNNMSRMITELGFDKKYTAEFFHDGKIDKKEFTVMQGPAYFENAPKYKQPTLGLTVKDLTYEVRRYMQKKNDDPGVIVGNIEIGGKASKAGIKPFEVITAVNDQPVMNVQDFAKFTKDQKEVRLSVKRMTHGRIVKITLVDDNATATQPAGNTAPTPPVSPVSPTAPRTGPGMEDKP